MVIKSCYIYTRVSTLTQVEGYSLDAQLGANRKYAQYRGLRIAGEYCDAGKSGKNIKGRPEFRKMMEDYEAFYDSYIAFMQNYSSSSDQLGMMKDYLDLLQQMQQWEESMDAIDESSLTPEEEQLYLDTTLRVASKLNKAALTMN